MILQGNRQIREEDTFDASQFPEVDKPFKNRLPNPDEMESSKHARKSKNRSSDARSEDNFREG